MTMLPCPDPGRLAAAASDEDAAALHHAATCDRCRPLVAELRATADDLAALAPPALSESRRAAIEDAVLVAVDSGALAAPRPRWPIAAALAAAAAVIIVAAVAIVGSGHRDRGPEAATGRPTATGTGTGTGIGTATGTGTGTAAGAATGTGTGTATATAAATATATAADTATATATAAATATATATDADAVPVPVITAVGTTDHSVDLASHRLDLRDGSVIVDTRASDPLSIALPNTTTISVDSARVEVRARKGVLVAVRVFAGSAEIAPPHGRRTEIVAGDVWTPDANRPPAPSAVDQFRRGWVALRAGDYAKATAAFDRATDPAVAEDAAFWAAVAQERAGATGDARTRFEQFMTAFPSSARVEAARQHLASLAP